MLLIGNQPSSVPSPLSSHLSRWKASLFISITQKHMLQRFSLLYIRKLYTEYEELDMQFPEIVANFCSDKKDLSEGCQGSVFNKITHSHCSQVLSSYCSIRYDLPDSTYQQFSLIKQCRREVSYEERGIRLMFLSADLDKFIYSFSLFSFLNIYYTVFWKDWKLFRPRTSQR